MGVTLRDLEFKASGAFIKQILADFRTLNDNSPSLKTYIDLMPSLKPEASKTKPQDSTPTMYLRNVAFREGL